MECRVDSSRAEGVPLFKKFSLLFLVLCPTSCSAQRRKLLLRFHWDYRTEDGYSKAVQFGGESFAFERGTGRLADRMEPLSEKLPLKEKAPAGWSGKGLISFFARNASGNYMETIRIASDAVKDVFDGMMD